MNDSISKTAFGAAQGELMNALYTAQARCSMLAAELAEAKAEIARLRESADNLARDNASNPKGA